MLPLGPIRTAAKHVYQGGKVSMTAVVAMAAVLEVLACGLIDVSIAGANCDKRLTVQPAHLVEGLRRHEVGAILGGIVGGTVPETASVYNYQKEMVHGTPRRRHGINHLAAARRLRRKRAAIARINFHGAKK